MPETSEGLPMGDIAKLMHRILAISSDVRDVVQSVPGAELPPAGQSAFTDSNIDAVGNLAISELLTEIRELSVSQRNAARQAEQERSALLVGATSKVMERQHLVQRDALQKVRTNFETTARIRARWRQLQNSADSPCSASNNFDHTLGSSSSQNLGRHCSD